MPCSSGYHPFCITEPQINAIISKKQHQTKTCNICLWCKKFVCGALRLKSNAEVKTYPHATAVCRATVYMNESLICSQLLWNYSSHTVVVFHQKPALLTHCKCVFEFEKWQTEVHIQGHDSVGHI